jgi:hypothetical protein
MTEMTNAVDTKVIKANITKIKRASNTINKLDHETAMLCLTHAYHCGDTTLLTKLFYALPKGARLESFKAWVSAYSPIHWQIKDKSSGAKVEAFRIPNGWEAKKDETFKLNDARENPYYSRVEAAPAPFTMDNAYKRIVALAKKLKAESEGDHLTPTEKREAKKLEKQLETVLPREMLDKLNAA